MQQHHRRQRQQLRRILAFAFFGVIAIVTACSVNVDVANKGCPCNDGLVCDPGTNRCVTTLPTQPNNADGSSNELPACSDADCPCTIDGDCRDPKRRVCGPNKTCVECVSSPVDSCTAGGYCNEKNQCTVGCKAEGDCPMPQRCQVATHRCVECIDDTQCGGGTKKCSPSGSCVEGCVGQGTACGNGGTCCETAAVGYCLALGTDVLNCGACGTACSRVNNSPVCVAGKCNLRCADGFAHCKPPADNTGCETNIRTATNCGGCGVACTAATIAFANGIACGSANKCTFASCVAGHFDKNNDPNDGCEQTCGAIRNEPCCPGDICVGGLNCNTAAGKCQ